MYCLQRTMDTKAKQQWSVEEIKCQIERELGKEKLSESMHSAALQ